MAVADAGREGGRFMSKAIIRLTRKVRERHGCVEYV